MTIELSKTERVCGDCQACCYVIRVDALEKPAFTNCKHQCESGCGDYENRPTNCRSFDCLWLGGFGSDEMKPNKLGAVFAGRKHPQLGYWASAQLLDKEVLNKEPFQRAVAMLAEHSVVIEILPNSMCVLDGPEDQVQLFMKATKDDLVPLQPLIPVDSLIRKK